MNSYIRIVVTCISVLVTIDAGILQAQETRLITLGKAVQIALENNIDLKQFSNQVAVSELSVRQAKADFYPNLNASVSASEGYGRTFDPITDRTEGQDSQSLNTRLSSSVTLFDGFNNVASLEKSKLDLAAQKESLSRTSQSIIFTTISQYLQILTDKELVLSEKENLEAQRQQLDLIEEFYRAGNRSIADVLQQKAAISQAELRVLTAERNLNVSKLQLLETMGLKPTVDYQVATLSMEDFTSNPVNGDSAQLVQNAVAKRPDVEAQKIRVDAANKQMRVARSGYWPSLSLSVDAGSSYSSQYEFGGFSDQVLDTKPNAGVGLSLSMPLFDRSRTKNNVEQAKVQLANERLGLESLKQEVTFQIQQALLDYQTAVKQLEVAEAQLAFARQALEATEGRYNVGASTLVELTQSRAQYVEAANDRVRARYNVLLNRVAVDYYQGDTDRTISLFE